MNMKKVILLLLAILTVISAVACSDNTSPAKDTDTVGGENEPVTDQTPERVIYDHVIIIGVDGAGNFHQQCDTPNMDRIFLENGAWTDYCRAAAPSISAQCWGSMLIGVKPSVHKLTNSIVGSNAYENSDYPSVFKLVRNAHPDAELGSFCNWYPISEGIVERDIGVTKERGEDDVLTEKICTYIKEKKPELLFIQFDSVDHAGHANSFGSEGHLAAIETVDGYVGQIYDAISEAGILDDTLLIITADHGGFGNTHGGASETEMNTFFGATGKSVNKTGDLTMFGRDIAAIVCHALGVDGNDKWDSYIPENLFTDSTTAPVRPKDETVEHKTEPTPAEGTDAALSNFIDMEKLRVGLFFDDGLTDLVGNESVNTVGTVYYPDGYYGSSIRVSSEGYLSFPNLNPGKDSLTFSFWLKVDEGVGGDPAIFSNKRWQGGANEGLVYCYCGISKFNVGDGYSARNDFEYDTPDPEDYTSWNHITVVIDREEGAVRYYSNFVEIACDYFTEELKNVSFNSGRSFNFGQDGTGIYSCPLSAEFDDLLIFNAALSADEVARLGEYYKK